MTLEKKSPKWRKTILSNVVAAVIVALPVFGFFRLYGSGVLGDAGPSGLVAAILGLFYVVMAVLTAVFAVGLPMSAIGSWYLSAEEATDLHAQRRMQAYAAASAAGMGGILIVLALAGPGGVVPQSAALATALALLAIIGLLTVLQWRHMDELMRNVSNETGNLAFYLVLLMGGGWAMLAHLGYARAPAPIDWLTMFFGLVLAATVITTARRGMLSSR